jgi:hypothetical protein
MALNKRQRRAMRRRTENSSVHKLIVQYEREIKSTAFSSEKDRLTIEIERLKTLIETNDKKSKLKATSVLPEKPRIRTSLGKKKVTKNGWTSVYQGGSTGLKK